MVSKTSDMKRGLMMRRFPISVEMTVVIFVV